MEAHARQMTAEVEDKRKEMIRRIHTNYQQRKQKIQEEKRTQSAEDRIMIDKLCITQDDIQREDMATLQFNPGSLNHPWFGELVTSRACKLTFVTKFGGFQQKVGVAVTQVGLLAVADYVGNDVSVYRYVKGEYKRQFCFRTSQPTFVAMVAVLPDCKFFISDNGLVTVFSPSGIY